MNKTDISNVDGYRMTVTSKELQQMLGCGRTAAEAIGKAAGAKIKVGRRVLWSVRKLDEYQYQMSGGSAR